jgi:hypothetical protein
MSNGTTNPSNTPNYSGVIPPEPTQNGTLQCGAWDDLNVPNGGPNGMWYLNVGVLEGLPAASLVTVTGQDARLKRVRTAQQYSLQISLAGDAGGYVLTGGLTTAAGGASTPVGDYFYAVSRQAQVATVSGLVITPTGRGSTPIEVRWPVGQVNANWTWGGSGGAVSNPSNFIYADFGETSPNRRVCRW